jgi:hypothetical protein
MLAQLLSLVFNARQEWPDEQERQKTIDIVLLVTTSLVDKLGDSTIQELFKMQRLSIHSKISWGATVLASVWKQSECNAC